MSDVLHPGYTVDASGDILYDRETVEGRNKRVRVFHTRSSAEFARRLARRIICDEGEIERRQFANGEEYYRICISSRQELAGADAIIVSSLTNDAEILEVFRVGCELASLGTRRRIFVIPYLGYSTMERAVHPGEIVTARANARLLSAIPSSGLGNTFLFCDLHVSGILQYFEGPCVTMELYSNAFLIESIHQNILGKLIPENAPIVFGSADLGRPLWVESFATNFGTDLAFIRKKRNHEDISTIGTPIGEVKDKYVIIYDDMTRSAGTLINAAECYLAAGAIQVFAVLSHLALASEDVIDKIEASCLQAVVTTNSHPMALHPKVRASKKFFVSDITSLFGNAIIDTYRHDDTFDVARKLRSINCSSSPMPSGSPYSTMSGKL